MNFKKADEWMLRDNITDRNCVAYAEHNASREAVYGKAECRYYAEAIRHMLAGWKMYAEASQSCWGSSIGADGFLGPLWRDIGKSLIGLLNGPLGGFDGGTLDSNIRKEFTDAGLTEDGEDSE